MTEWSDNINYDIRGISCDGVICFRSCKPWSKGVFIWRFVNCWCRHCCSSGRSLVDCTLSNVQGSAAVLAVFVVLVVGVVPFGFSPISLIPCIRIVGVQIRLMVVFTSFLFYFNDFSEYPRKIIRVCYQELLLWLSCVSACSAAAHLSLCLSLQLFMCSLIRVITLR